ncbi:hypothetical protein D3C80_1167250 [compost metagenome]
MVEGVEGGGQTGVQVAGDVARLKHVVLLQADGGGFEVVGRGAAVGVDIIDRQVRLVAMGLGHLIQGVDQLPGLLGRQVLGSRALALVPPVGLRVGVPSVPHHVPARVGGRRHLQNFDEGIGCAQPLQTGDRLCVVGVGDGDDAIAATGVVELGQGGEGRLHRPFQLSQDGIEQDDEGHLRLGGGQGVVHVHAVDAQRAEIHLQQEAA